MAESKTAKGTWNSTCFKFTTVLVVFTLLGIVVYLTVARFKTSTMQDSSILLDEGEKPSSTSKTHSSDTTDSSNTPSTSSSSRSSTDDIVYSAIGDVVSLIVPETEEVRGRIHRAKNLKHQGRNDTFLSDSLVDLLGFGSECEFPNNGETDSDRTGTASKRPDFDTLLIVSSRPNHWVLRNIIRTTWGNPEQCRRYRVLLRFVMGSPRTDQDVQLLRNESEAFGDILVGNFTDRVTRASAFKPFLAIRWALSLQCPVSFVVYSYDFTFMLLEKLPDLLSTFDDSIQFKSVLGSKSIRHLNWHHADYYNENPLAEQDFSPPTCDTYVGCISPFVLATELYTKFIWTTRLPLHYFDTVLGLAAEEYQWKVRYSDVFSRNVLARTEQACEMKKKCTTRIHNIDILQPLWEKISDPDSMNNCE